MTHSRAVSGGQALVVGFAATAISIAVVNAIYVPCVGQFATLRQPRTDSLFAPIFIHALPNLALLWITGSCIVFMRRWLLPSVICFILLPVFEAPTAWSGPGDLVHAIQPLREMRSIFFEVGIVLNAGLIYLWLQRQCRISSIRTSGIPAAS